MNTIADPLRHALQTASAHTAIVQGNKSFTYAELAERCMRLGTGMARFGLAKGDRVAILAANSHQYIEAYVGVPAAGFVVVPLNTRHAQPELEYALRDSDTKILLTDRDPAPFEKIVPHVIPFGPNYESLLASAVRLTLGEDVVESDLAGLFYTGGTTGASKGVMLTHRNLIANTMHFMTIVGHSSSDRFMIAAPMFHAAGSNSILPTIWTAATQIPLPAFDPGAALDLIESERITSTIVVPTMLAAMAEEQLANPRKTETLCWVAHGGSPIATTVIARAHEAFPSAQLVEIYGSTELSPIATVLNDEQELSDDKRGRSCGRPVVGVDVRIRADSGAETKRGEVGQVVVRGPNVMQGYWNKPEQTAAVLRDTGYWTGDLGYMDEDGYVFLVDRSKDMIVSGGENVYSTEVEEALYKHPAVLEAAAFGVPDAKWGEVVHAVVVLRPVQTATSAADLIAHCRDNIAGYKVPKAIDIRDQPLPKSGPGKVLKRELRQPFWEGKERGVN